MNKKNENKSLLRVIQLDESRMEQLTVSSPLFSLNR